MIRLPGLIDPHVHLRDPGQTQKEDFHTGTNAALAGGYTILIDMPNNITPITTYDKLKEKQQLAQDKIVCDVGFHFGSVGDNTAEFKKVKDFVIGLKLYFNQTTGGYILPLEKTEAIFAAWPINKPILIHAEESILPSVLELTKNTKQHIHVCHVSTERELTMIMQARETGQSITCGVTPHHLFLTKAEEKILGPYGKMKPSLKPQQDVTFLWQHLSAIDVIQSDHAPHTKDEKKSANPTYGVPGLETTLPLLLTAMNEGRITIDEIIEKCHTRPKEIFHLPDQTDTYVEVDETEEWTIKNEKLFTKSKWSPFDEWKAKGKVKKVILRGTKVFEDGTILADAGTGIILTNE